MESNFEAQRVTNRLSTCCRQMKDVIMQMTDVMKLHTKTRCTSWQRYVTQWNEDSVTIFVRVA
jgi:hypothetical protein